MKKCFGLIVCLFLVAAGTPAHAGIFGTAGILRPGQVALGLEPSFAFSPAEFMLYLHGGVGLIRSVDLDLKVGFGSHTYFGADVEFGLIPDTSRSLGLSFTAGAHGTSNFGLDATLLVSNRFPTFSLYGALDLDAEFSQDPVTQDARVDVPLYFDLGVAIPLARRMEFLLEGNIGVTAPANSGLSGGLIFYL